MIHNLHNVFLHRSSLRFVLTLADLSSLTERTFAQAHFAPVASPPAFLPFGLHDTFNLVVYHIHVSSHSHFPFLITGGSSEFA